MYVIYIPWLLTWTEWADQVLSWLKCIHLRGDRGSRDDKSEKTSPFASPWIIFGHFSWREQFSHLLYTSWLILLRRNKGWVKGEKGDKEGERSRISREASNLSLGTGLDGIQPRSSRGCVHMTAAETPGAHSQSSPHLCLPPKAIYLLGFYLMFVTIDLGVVLLWLKLVHRIQLSGMREGRRKGGEEGGREKMKERTVKWKEGERKRERKREERMWESRCCSEVHRISFHTSQLLVWDS